MHESDEPNALVDLFDSKPLTSQHNGDVDLLAKQTGVTAIGDENVAVMEWIR
jgi:hypothetical protein